MILLLIFSLTCTHNLVVPLAVCQAFLLVVSPPFKRLFTVGTHKVLRERREVGREEERREAHVGREEEMREGRERGREREGREKLKKEDKIKN